MNNECKDRDLLAMEPVLFLGRGQAAQILAAGADGEIAGGRFHCLTADFLQAGILPGMVLTVWTTTAGEGLAYEIVSVEAPTQMTISILRADDQGPALPPPAQTGLSFHVMTYRPQIEGVTGTLAEKLRRIGEAVGVDFLAGDLADSAQLRRTVAYGCLTDVFVLRSENSGSGDANWIKAEHYRQLFRESQTRLRLAVDAGDGRAEQTRSLGNVTLRRV
jgi:hypothetical protein